MKKVSLAICIILLSMSAFTQKATAQTKTNSIYLDLGGPAGLYSVNYDIRFQNSVDGWGARIGLSYFSLSNESLITVPVQINYLIGGSGNYLELGLGATFARHDEDSGDDYSTITKVYGPGYDIFGSFTLGYRYQPVDGGFLFRVGLSPLFNGERVKFLYPYLSFGYSF